LIVVIGIIAILIGLVFPALGPIREQSLTTQSNVVMRQFHMSLTQYCADYQEGFPFFATPGKPRAPLFLNGADMSRAQGVYFRPQGAYWASLVIPYFDGNNPQLPRHNAFREQGEKFGLPPDDNAQILWSRYWLAHCAFADKRFWTVSDTGGPNLTPLSLLRGQRQIDVVFPSDKGILIDIASGIFMGEMAPYAGDAVHTCAADGSIRILLNMGTIDVVPQRFDAWPRPIFSTIDGLAGRDPLE
jgi:type II secretory pathway pseudopilin PulG